MSGHLRWGVLGTGGIARTQVLDLQLVGIPVTAVGSRSRSSADAYAADFGIPRAHGSYEEFVADPEVDVVYVATPHPMHADHAVLALEAGKHVLVEKPFALNAAEARRIVDTATANGRVALEAMWTRVLPHMVRIRELIAQGAIGTPLALIADHSQALPADPAHRLQSPELGGGALLDLGIYPVSFAWDLFGAPDAVRSLGVPTATGVDGRTSILFGYASGARALLHTQLDARGPNSAVVIGSEGRIEIDATWYARTRFRVLDRDDALMEEFDGREGPGRGMQFQALALERVVATGENAHAPVHPEQSVAIMASLDEVRAQLGLRYPGE